MITNEKIKVVTSYTLLLLVVIISAFFYFKKTNEEREVWSKYSNEEFRKLEYIDQVGLINKMAEKDPARTWKFLKDTFFIDGAQVGNVHDLAHTIGNQAYEKYGIDGVKICDDTFAFGCFHGVSEEMLQKYGIDSIILIEKSCKKVFPVKNISYRSCIHGSGHGLYLYHNSDIKKSLSSCDLFEEDFRQYCYDGVFMERTNNQGQLFFDPNNPWKMCASLDEKYKYNCARYEWNVFLMNSKSDIKKVGEYCDLAPNSILKERCFESLGYYISQSNRGEVNGIIDMCRKLKTEKGLNTCITGAAIETVFQKYPNHMKNYKSLCGQLRGDERDSCVNRVENLFI